jgi:hypothetical protein
LTQLFYHPFYCIRRYESSNSIVILNISVILAKKMKDKLEIKAGFYTTK